MARPTLSATEAASLPLGLLDYLAELEGRLAALEAENARLREQLAAAMAKGQQHSGTSSRPPSSDPPDAPQRPGRGPTGRGRGGQRGHEGHQRAVLSSDQVDAVVVHRPAVCPGCQTPLPPDLPAVGAATRHQVWDIPEVVHAEVVEHQ